MQRPGREYRCLCTTVHQRLLRCHSGTLSYTSPGVRATARYRCFETDKVQAPATFYEFMVTCLQLARTRQSRTDATVRDLMQAFAWCSVSSSSSSISTKVLRTTILVEVESRLRSRCCRHSKLRSSRNRGATSSHNAGAVEPPRAWRYAVFCSAYARRKRGRTMRHCSSRTAHW